MGRSGHHGVLPVADGFVEATRSSPIAGSSRRSDWRGCRWPRLDDERTRVRARRVRRSPPPSDTHCLEHAPTVCHAASVKREDSGDVRRAGNLDVGAPRRRSLSLLRTDRCSGPPCQQRLPFSDLSPHRMPLRGRGLRAPSRPLSLPNSEPTGAESNFGGSRSLNVTPAACMRKPELPYQWIRGPMGVELDGRFHFPVEDADPLQIDRSKRRCGERLAR